MSMARYLVAAAVACTLLGSGLAAEPLPDDRRSTDIMPKIVFVPPDALQTKACRRNAHCLAAKGLYVPSEHRIYLRNDWSADNFDDLAILLHEFVHHLQTLGKVEYGCETEIELPAYALQETFYKVHRRNPEGRVPSDFTRFTRYSCLMQE